MDIETYLRGEQSRKDARALIGHEIGRVLSICNDKGALWRGIKGVWNHVYVCLTTERGREELSAYYQPESDGFRVSDCCGGMHDFMERTGRLFFTKTDVAAVTCSLTTIGSCGDVQTLCVRSAVDLPDALCRVLLASYKVANLDERGMG